MDKIIKNKGFAILLIIILTGTAILATAGGLSYQYFITKSKEKALEKTVNIENKNESKLTEEATKKLVEEFKKKQEGIKKVEKSQEIAPSPKKSQESTKSTAQVIMGLKKFDVSLIIPAIVKLKCYLGDEKEPSFLGSGTIIGSRKGDEHPEKFINDIIATSGHLLVDDMGNEISGCDVYVSDQTGESVIKKFYAMPYNNHLFFRLINNKGTEVDGLDYSMLRINGFNRSDPINYFFNPPDIKNIYEINKDFCNEQRKVKIGEKIYVFGYPMIGGETITVTDGIISGFWDAGIKFSALLDEGNSGGAIITEDGCFLGVPTFGVMGKLSTLSYGIDTSVIANFFPEGESTYALAARDAKRLNDLMKFHIAIDKYFQDKGFVPESLKSMGENYYDPGKINYSPDLYKYAYRADKKAFHMGVTLEETTSQFNEYNKTFGPSSDSDFNSLSSGYINGFDGSDSKTCLSENPQVFGRPQNGGKWCFDVIDDYLKITILQNNLFSRNSANIFEIFNNFLNRLKVK